MQWPAARLHAERGGKKNKGLRSNHLEQRSRTEDIWTIMHEALQRSHSIYTHRLRSAVMGHTSIVAKFKMAASNQFQCRAWQHLKSDCSISRVEQRKHQQERFSFCTIYFPVTAFWKWSHFTYLKQGLFFRNLLSINPGGESLLTSSYLLYWKTRPVLMCRNKAIHHPVHRNGQHTAPE